MALVKDVYRVTKKSIMKILLIKENIEIDGDIF